MVSTHDLSYICLRRRRPKPGQRSLRTIAAELAAAGHLNERGAPYSAKTIASMLS